MRIDSYCDDLEEEPMLRLREVFSGVLLETDEGNQVGICMRDDTLEINVCPLGVDTGNWWRINMQNGSIEKMDGAAGNDSRRDAELAEG